MRAWDGIDEFVAVAMTGSFSAAAASFGASTTHMSRSIARLEARLQAQLFHRTTRTVKLTDTGTIFLQHCQRLVRERDEAVAEISEGGEPQGELRVTCSTTLGERFLAPIVRRYVADHPKVSVSIELTNRLVDLVGEGVDLAIRTGQLADSRLVARRIASRTLYTCASPAYLAKAPPLDRVEDLAAHDCLIGTSAVWHFRVGQGRSRQSQQGFRPAGRYRSNSGVVVVDAAVAGAGVCQLPDFYILPYLGSGQLVPVLERFRLHDEPIWAVYPRRRHLLPKIARLVERLQVEFPLALRGE